MTEDKCDGADWLGTARFALMVALLVVASFPNEALGLGTFFFRDFAHFTAPLASYHRSCFWEGNFFPLWNPLSNAGAPYLAQWNTITLYPGTLIYLLLPFPWGLNLYMLAHFFWAALGMRKLLLAWTGSPHAAAWAGVAFAFSGLMLNCLMWSNYIASFAWMPWTVWWVEKACREGGRNLAYAAAIGSIQMLSGTPEVVLLTWLLLVVLVLGKALNRPTDQITTALRQNAGRLLALVAWVSALAAIQLLPFLDLLAHSNRHSEFGDGRWALPITGWANLLLPVFHTFPAHHGVHFQPDQFWTSSYYPGLATLVLALLVPGLTRSRRACCLWLLTWACLLMALGERGGLYAAMRRALPLTGFMRFPVKFMLLPAFLFPCLAAYSIQSYEQARARGSFRAARWFWGAAAFSLLVLAWLVIASFRHPVPGESPRFVLQHALIGGTLLLCTLGALRFWSDRETTQYRLLPWHIWAPWLPLLLVWLDVQIHAPNQNPTASRWVYDAEIQQMPNRPQAGRDRAMISASAQATLLPASIANPDRDVVFKRQALFDNANLIDRIPKVDGMFSLFLKEHDSIRSLLYGATNLDCSSLLDFLGVTQITAPDAIIRWQSRPSALPMVTAGQKTLPLHDAAVQQALTDPSWDPRRVAFLAPETQPLSPNSKETAVKTELTHFSPHRLDIRAEAENPCILVVAQSYHHNWKARIDGHPTAVLRANGAFQAVALPAGRSLVSLKYVDQAFHCGAALSAIAWAALLVVCCRKRQTTNPLPPRAHP